MSQPNATPYKASAWSDIAAAGCQRVTHPLPQECPIQHDAYAIQQAFNMAASAFGTSPAPKNTPAADFSADLTDENAILTNISQPSDNGGSLISFDATFNRVPDSWNDFSRSFTYTFAGFAGLFGGDYREPFAETVPCRVLREYFVLDPDNIISGATAGGGVVNSTSILDSAGNAVKCVATLGDIPFIPKTKIVSSLSATLRTNIIVQDGGVVINGVSWYETLPNRESYEELISNGEANQWDSTVWAGTNTVASSEAQIVADDSTLEVFAGNIVCRQTIYILAK